MTVTLKLAGLYNLLWGTMVILWPRQLFELLSLEPVNYPSLVQCLGMVIGVYGVGYWIAARDPVTHWPIILVGLLGKVLGPLGFVWTAWQGELPWIMGWTILTNDLIRWLPFLGILLFAVREHDARRLAQRVGDLSREFQQARTNSGTTLAELSQERPLFMVLVRHAGCTYCREMLADLRAQLETVKSSGLQPVVVHMGNHADGEQLLQQFQLTGVEIVSDPQRHLYHALDLPLGTLTQLAGPQVIWRSLTSGVFLKHGFGRMVGHGMQLGGVFVIDHGQVIRAYRCQTTADRPDFATLACPLESSTVSKFP